MDEVIETMGVAIDLETIQLLFTPTGWGPRERARVTRAALRAAEEAGYKLVAAAEIARLREALRYARPLVEKWCHTQGDADEFFRETLAPIDAALGGKP